MTIEGVVYKGDNLLINLGLIDIKTWNNSVEVFKAKDFDVITNNLAVYRIIDGQEIFNLVGPEGNLFVDGKFREDVYYGILKNNEFFLPKGEMKEYVISAINNKKSVQVNYSGLNLYYDSNANNTIEEYIKVHENNTDEEKKLITGVYGIEIPDIGKKIYKIYLLKTNVVKKVLKNNPNELIVLPCYFYKSQNFDAIARKFLDYHNAVRGILLNK